MTRPIATVALIPVALLTITCHKSSSPAPTAPSSAPAAAVTSIVIQGPSRIAPGDTVQFTAVATLSDRTTRNYTRDVKWVVSPKGVLTISETGEAVALARGEAHVFAYIPSGCRQGCSGETVVVVLPPDTYRLTGKVLESGLPVQGATATVIGGSDSGLSATTDYEGQYRLYGVAGRVQIKVAKPGYEDMAKAVTVTVDDVLDFPEARQTGAIPLVSGTYVLTLQADNDCSTAPSAYNVPPLPPDFRQRRTYSAQLAQDGPSLSVSLPPPQFAAPSNLFSGRIHPGTVEFVFGNGYLYYGPENAITERLSATQAISFEGFVRAERSGSALIGPLDGAIQVFEISDSGSGRPIPKLIGQCRAPNHRFTMTPSTGRLR